MDETVFWSCSAAILFMGVLRTILVVTAAVLKNVAEEK